MGFEPIKAKIGRQPAPQATQPGKRLCGLRLAGDLKGALAHDMQLDFLTFLQLQRLNHRSRQTDGERVSPFGDLHEGLLVWIYIGR